MPEKKENITNQVTWNQICKLAKGNPLNAIWAITLWTIVNHFRLILYFFALIVILNYKPKLFTPAIFIGSAKDGIATLFKKLLN